MMLKNEVIRDFETHYLELFHLRSLAQWEFYVTGTRYDAAGVAAAFHDLAVSFDHKLRNASASDLKASGSVDTRERVCLIRRIIMRDLVDCHPEIAKLRVRIDDPEASYGSLPDPVTDRDEYRTKLSHRMKPDVLELMQLRKRLASELGYDGYRSLVFDCESIDARGLNDLLNRHLKEFLASARSIIETYSIRLTSGWFENLENFGKPPASLSAESAIRLILEGLGFDHLAPSIHLAVRDDGFGFSDRIGPGDIRIMSRPLNSLDSLNTLFHETGHAIAYAMNAAPGLFLTHDAGFDEAMATVMEPFAAWMLLDEKNRNALRDLRILTSCRCALSAQFEFQVWENPDDAEYFHEVFFGQMAADTGSPDWWMLDTFRSLDPMYIFHYVIGYRLALRLIRHFESVCNKSGFLEFGRWMNHSYYADGRRRSLAAKTADAGLGSLWVM